jgi:hypothetical protein
MAVLKLTWPYYVFVVTDQYSTRIGLVKIRRQHSHVKKMTYYRKLLEQLHTRPLHYARRPRSLQVIVANRAFRSRTLVHSLLAAVINTEQTIP